MSNIRSESVDRLINAILKLETADECYNFLEDVCTINEVLDMAQRFDVALMLDEGKNYQSIAKEANVSTATISRVSRCLNYGNGGYKIAIERIKSEK